MKSSAINAIDQTLPKRRPSHKTRLPSVLVMTDEKRLPDPVAVAQTIPPSWGLIMRHYDHSHRETLARKTTAVCRARGLVCLIAGDWRLAAQVNADGVHMPEGMLRTACCAAFKLWCRKGKLLTVSAHGRNGLRQAASLGVDAVLLSPVATTESHPDRKPIGLHPYAALVRSRSLPVYALGGMTLAHSKTIRAIGGAGIAGIGFAETVS